MSSSITPRERLTKCLSGQPVDRVPIYTQIPFALGEGGFEPGAFHGYADLDNWRKQDPAYWRLVRRMERECDNFFIWRPPCMQSDQFFVPPARVSTAAATAPDGRLVTTSSLRAGNRELVAVTAAQPRTGHTWTLEHYCKSPDDARALLDLPWEGPPPEAGDFAALQDRLGDRGLMWVTVPSPILVVCRLFDPTEFLMFVRSESVLVHRLLETAAERIRTNLAALLDAGVGPVIRFGGAEHCTPPLMGPVDFDDFVVRYDTPLMELARRHGCRVAVHCHGRIRHALRRFLEMGVEQTDPVEQPPDGEVTPREAREITEGRITLTGNIQMRELASLAPADIKARVRQVIADAGPRRLVITSTGTPIEPISPTLEANYNAMIDAVLETA